MKYASKDLIDQLLRLVNSQQVHMIFKTLEFIKDCFEKKVNLRGQATSLSLKFIECLIALMIHCYKKLSTDNEALLQEAELIVERLISKELFNEHDLIKARVCNLIAVYGVASVNFPESVMVICQGMEAAMNSTHLAVQTSALVALNKCTINEKFSSYFSNHLPQVFELVINCMKSVDYKELVYAAEG